jgi:osmotically-inducible protein OsmY
MKRTLTALALAAAALATLPGCIPLAITAGAGTAVLMAGDRRTTGMYIEDENIELKILGIKDRFKGAHVNGTSFNRHVLLTGEAPDEATRSRIEADVRAISNVKEVTNEIQVAGSSSLASRGSDALITSNVKARMVNNPRFAANHVKVVTEAGTVYLMGLVSPEEGDAAVDIARTTSGVVRVVKVFEYIGK